MNLPEANKLFNKVGWDNPLIDATLTKLHGTPVFDIFAFDDFLHDKFGDYENETEMNMKKFIEFKWGKNTAEELSKAFGIM